MVLSHGIYFAWVLYLGLGRGNWIYPFLSMMSLPTIVAFGAVQLGISCGVYIVFEKLHQIIWASELKEDWTRVKCTSKLLIFLVNIVLNINCNLKTFLRILNGQFLTSRLVTKSLTWNIVFIVKHDQEIIEKENVHEAGLFNHYYCRLVVGYRLFVLLMQFSSEYYETKRGNWLENQIENSWKVQNGGKNRKGNNVGGGITLDWSQSRIKNTKEFSIVDCPWLQLL